MKRDMDLIRKILLTMEEHEHGRAPKKIEIESYSKEQIDFHLWLMGQAGLLEVADTTNNDSQSPEAIPLGIAWEGYEFLEVAREPSRWKSAMEKVTKSGAAMTIEMLKGVLVALSKQTLGLK